jgi:hypothetical protein
MEENGDLRTAWEFIEHTGKSVFLTGKAGTGKTTFLKTLRKRSTKRMIVVAPTGVAAINAEGMTIHSFFQLPPSPFIPQATFKNHFEYSKEKRNIMRTLDLLVIDEISMVRCDLLDAIDHVMRKFREHDKPFGGVQLLMIGDLQQLTPVVTPEETEILKSYYNTPYFFGSKALQSIGFITIELHHVYRQQDEKFIHILNHIRDGQPTEEDLTLLNSRYDPTFHPKTEEGYIRLTTHNRSADNYNGSELEKLTAPPYTYQARIKGTFPEYSYPTGVELTLKTGAQVMFVKNDPSEEKRFYNGRIGRVISLGEDLVQVQCQGDDEPIDVKPETWENDKYIINPETKVIEPEVQGTFEQFPLRLAWAITIHKSQGLTFEHAIIDARFSFASGQVYVALSRCKSLEGLVLASSISTSSVIRDQRVDSFIQKQADETAASIQQLPTLKEEYFRDQLMELFNFNELTQETNSMLRLMAESFRRYSRLLNAYQLLHLQLSQKIVPTARKWITVIAAMEVPALHEEEFQERVKRSAGYFLEELRKAFGTTLLISKEINTDNKTAKKRMENDLSALSQTYHIEIYLLAHIAAKGFSTANYQKFKQEGILSTLEGSSPARKRKETKSKPKREDTRTVTLKMLQAGKKPQEVAVVRHLTLATIQAHIAALIEKKLLAPEGWLSDETLADVRQAQEKSNGGGLSAIRENCKFGITYNQLELAMVILKRLKDKKQG